VDVGTRVVVDRPLVNGAGVIGAGPAYHSRALGK
jgi:hypothetical protein